MKTMSAGTHSEAYPYSIEVKIQGSQIRQNCSDDSTEVTEGVTSTPEIFSNKQGATLTPEICGNKHSFVPNFFTTNTIYVNATKQEEGKVRSKFTR